MWRRKISVERQCNDIEQYYTMRVNYHYILVPEAIARILQNCGADTQQDVHAQRSFPRRSRLMRDIVYYLVGSSFSRNLLKTIEVKKIRKH